MLQASNLDPGCKYVILIVLRSLTTVTLKSAAKELSGFECLLCAVLSFQLAVWSQHPGITDQGES